MNKLTYLIPIILFSCFAKALLPNADQMDTYEMALQAIHSHDVPRLHELLNYLPNITTIKDDQNKTLMHHAAASIPAVPPQGRIAFLSIPLMVISCAVTLLLKNVAGVRNKILALGLVSYFFYQATPSFLLVFS